jgi:hypothetical protein
MRAALTLLSFLLLLPAALAQPSPLDKKELAMLAKLDKEELAAKTTFAKHPKDAQAKHKYIALALDLAHKTEASPALESKPKYRKAYLLYKEVLKADPGNKDAKQRIEMYDKIYKSLKRPSPK